MPKQTSLTQFSEAELKRKSREQYYDKLAERGIRLSDFAGPISPAIEERWEADRMARAIRVRNEYKWSWGAGAEFLYCELIRALNLQHRERDLLELAKSRPGRKQEAEVHFRVNQLKSQGNTAAQIVKILAAENINLSREAVESHLKTRRKRRSL